MQKLERMRVNDHLVSYLEFVIDPSFVGGTALEYLGEKQSLFFSRPQCFELLHHVACSVIRDGMRMDALVGMICMINGVLITVIVDLC